MMTISKLNMDLNHSLTAVHNLFQPDIVGRDRRRKKPPRIERK